MQQDTDHWERIKKRTRREFDRVEDFIGVQKNPEFLAGLMEAQFDPLDWTELVDSIIDGLNGLCPIDSRHLTEVMELVFWLEDQCQAHRSFGGKTKYPIPGFPESEGVYINDVMKGLTQCASVDERLDFLKAILYDCRCISWFEIEMEDEDRDAIAEVEGMRGALYMYLTEEEVEIVSTLYARLNQARRELIERELFKVAGLGDLPESASITEPLVWQGKWPDLVILFDALVVAGYLEEGQATDELLLKHFKPKSKAKDPVDVLQQNRRRVKHGEAFPDDGKMEALIKELQKKPQ